METMMGRKVVRHSPPGSPYQDDEISSAPTQIHPTPAASDIDVELERIDRGGTPELGKYKGARRAFGKSAAEGLKRWLPKSMRYGKEK